MCMHITSVYSLPSNAISRAIALRPNPLGKVPELYSSISDLVPKFVSKAIGRFPIATALASSLLCWDTGGGIAFEYCRIFSCFNGAFFASSACFCQISSYLDFSSSVQFGGGISSMCDDLKWCKTLDRSPALLHLTLTLHTKQ